MSEILSVTTIAALLNATAGLIDDATVLIRMSDQTLFTDPDIQKALARLHEATERASSNGHILHEECEALERERTGEHPVVDL